VSDTGVRWDPAECPDLGLRRREAVGRHSPSYRKPFASPVSDFSARPSDRAQPYSEDL